MQAMPPSFSRPQLLIGTIARCDAGKAKGDAVAEEERHMQSIDAATHSARHECQRQSASGSLIVVVDGAAVHHHAELIARR